jgi:hypothetical protein
MPRRNNDLLSNQTDEMPFSCEEKCLVLGLLKSLHVLAKHGLPDLFVPADC